MAVNPDELKIDVEPTENERKTKYVRLTMTLDNGVKHEGIVQTDENMMFMFPDLDQASVTHMEVSDDIFMEQAEKTEEQSSSAERKRQKKKKLKKKVNKKEIRKQKKKKDKLTIDEVFGVSDTTP